jgi:hypothetical protein
MFTIGKLPLVNIYLHMTFIVLPRFDLKGEVSFSLPNFMPLRKVISTISIVVDPPLEDELNDQIQLHIPLDSPHPLLASPASSLLQLFANLYFTLTLDQISSRNCLATQAKTM